MPVALGGTDARVLDGPMLLTLATILLYALTIGFVVYAALNEPSGGLFANTLFMGR